MRICNPKENFLCHDYELELKTLALQAERYLDNIADNRLFSGLTVTQIKKNIKDIFDNYYSSQSIDPYLPVVIEPVDPPYQFYLAIALAVLDRFKISLFLNYHKDHYSSKENFVGLIQHNVYDISKSIIPIEDNDRQERIMKWVVNNKRKAVVKKPTKISLESSIKELKWNAEKSVLRRLAKQLKQEPHNCIKQVKDFYNVFESGQAVWYGSAESLAYLFYKITIPPYAWVQVANGKPPFTKSVQHYFNFCDNAGKIVQRNDLAKVLNNVTKRSFKKHTKLRTVIDSMLKEIVQGAEIK